jgi:DNA-binding LacI/PurR family transcriptional regulator
MKRTPKYAQVAAKLRRDIEKRLSPGDRLPAEPELCEKYDVSMITVRQAVKELAGLGIVSREQGRGTFVLDQRAQQSIKRVAFIYRTAFASLGEDPVTGEVFAGVFAACSAEQISALAIPVAGGADGVPHDRRLLNAGACRDLGADGLILYAGPFPDDYVRGIATGSGLPLVLVNGSVDSIPSVSVDNRGGATAALEHLHARGHRRIGFIYYHHWGRLSASFDERYQTYVAFCRKRRLDASPSLVAGVDAASPHGNREAQALLAARPTAVFAGNDHLAMAVYGAARRLKLSIPGDIDVVGFDDAPDAARATPPLTTVRGPVRDLGREAVAMVARLSKGGARVKSRRIKTELVVRASTMPLPDKSL